MPRGTQALRFPLDVHFPISAFSVYQNIITNQHQPGINRDKLQTLTRFIRFINFELSVIVIEY